jgi:hypothetical protein
MQGTTGRQITAQRTVRPGQGVSYSPSHVLGDLLVFEDVFSSPRLVELSVGVVLRVSVGLGSNLCDVFPLCSVLLTVLFASVSEDLSGYERSTENADVSSATRETNK